MCKDKKNIEELYKVIVSINDEETCKEFFEDLCTNLEIEKMAQRVDAAKKLINGETYENIISNTDISSATLSRVSRCVKYGTGYISVLKKDE